MGAAKCTAAAAGPCAATASPEAAARPGHRGAGRPNQAALQALGIQAKLRFGQAGDAAEREADALAERFAGGGETPCCSACAASATPGLVQRQALPGAAAQPAVERLPLGDGTPLPAALRTPLERHLDADLSAVRIHTDQRAALASERIGARAFTHGSDIAFGAGEYRPSSREGRRLIAHEVVHTVQQGRGAGAPRQRGGGPRAQAEGGFDAEQMRLLEAWQKDQANRASLTAFDQLNAQKPRTAFGDPNFGFPSKAAQADFEAGFGKGQGERYDDVCPSCHKRPWEIREERQQRAAEEARRKLLARWPGLHKAQHETALDEQAQSLREDIAGTQLAATKARLALFDNALKAPPMLGDELLGLPTGALTPELRLHWLQAAQATVLVDNYIDAPAGSIAPEAMAPAQKAYASYFGTVSKLLGEMDRAEDKRRLRRDARRAMPKMSCPGGCHAPAPTPATDFLEGFGAPLPGALPRSEPALPDDVRTTSTGTATKVGPRVLRINQALASSQAATDVAAWKKVRTEYRWSVGEMDRILRTRGNWGWEGKDLVDQFDFAQGLLERQQAFQDKHPEALKIQAVFYPEFEFEDVTDDKGRRTTGARGIPWHFYLVRTPVEPGSKTVPVGYTWELHDITAPLRPGGRTVKQAYTVNMYEGLARERFDPRSIDRMDPPPTLFEELNHRDFFPKGMLYWRYPLTGTPGQLKTTAPRPFGDWLKLIGMALVVIGGVLMPMFGAPAALALATAMGGTALSILGGYHRLQEMDAHGVLTQADVDRFYWDVALDLVNMLTMGLGRIATVARAAGSATRAARIAESAYFYVRRGQIAMDVINVGVVGHDFVAQFRAIQNSKMSPEEKSRAMRELVMMGLLTGAMTFATLRAGAHDWNKRPQLTLDADPLNPRQLTAGVDEAAEAVADAAGHNAARGSGKAKEVGQLVHHNPVNRETHTYRLWDDGRITRCSGPPCLLHSQNTVDQVQELSEHMLTASQHRPALQDLAGRAATVREEAAAAVKAPAAQRQAQADAVLAKVKALDEELAALKKQINTENLAYEKTGRDEARARFGEGAMNYEPDQYRWVFNRKTGELQFQRRSIAVPWKEWKDGQFVVTRGLFPAADPVAAQAVRESSITKDFPITATIDRVADLRRLRPASPLKNYRPKDWVLVKIDDNNLHEFFTEAIPHGTIFEFPGGQRTWRTPEGTIRSDAPLGAPIGRRGWEAGKPPQLRVDAEGISNEGVPVRETTGVDHQRAHTRGQGTGFELYNHIPLAPTYVNQQLQARGIELYFSQLTKARPDLDLRLVTEHQTFSGTTRQHWIDYQLAIVDATGRRNLFKVRIWTDYHNPAKPARTQVLEMPRSAADADLVMNTVDMKTALAEMEAAIRNARARRR
ncbi:DUF4157 domain-containing protein [Aquincola sp. MAHUQ-54]|uniref:DUF4157 domain-containing protein n=1 Tax=Aquincola agrisoli TaxID=3119538 RepID=A0AAW9QFK1_9BURK